MLNQVQLIGHLGADPEVKTFQDGGKVANLSVATSEKWRDRSTGETRERTEWHRVTLRGDGLVDAASRYTGKGSRVFVQGKLATRKWSDRDGNDRYTTEIIVAGFGGQFRFLDRRGDSAGGGEPEPGGASAAAEIDDEIPF